VTDLPDALAGTPSRRSLLVAGLGVGSGLLLVGCSSESDDEGGRAARSPASPAAPAAPASTTPDVAVATLALSEIRTAAAAVRATGVRFPDLRGDLAGLGAMHQAHERSLAEAVPAPARTSATPAPYAVPRRRDAALRRLTTTEQGLHDTLGRLAMRAQSGQFARLLASMGTGVTVRVTELAS
jgi:hypothetical protein